MHLIVKVEYAIDKVDISGYRGAGLNCRCADKLGSEGILGKADVYVIEVDIKALVYCRCISKGYERSSAEPDITARNVDFGSGGSGGLIIDKSAGFVLGIEGIAAKVDIYLLNLLGGDNNE